AYSQFLATIKNTLNSVFQNVIVLPVAKATYIAQDRRWEKDLREILKENIIDRKLNLKYVNPDIFDYTLNQEKIMYIENRLD
ncbi:MAG: hypothetical protein N3A65_09205, partial [candidate division WOR-3 bacterium]|nr:hypothetical protein [candidate division WOR-3 bacterium]